VTSRSRSSNSAATGKDVGPGTYEAEHGTILREAVEKQNPRLPPFSSSRPRSASGAANVNVSLGPGTYDPDAGMTMIDASARTFNKSASSGSANFGTNSRREGMRVADGVDPGMYDLETEGVHLGNKEAMSHKTKRSFNTEAHKGRGSFNSTTPRPSSAPPKKPTRGGPGEHDYSHMYTCGKNSVGMSSAFRSSSPLGGHVRKSTTPGVGSYEPNDAQTQRQNLSSQSAKSFSKDGSSMFAGVGVTSRSRSSNSAATGKDVGPGTYASDQGTILREAVEKHNPRLPAFGSSSTRQGPDEM